MVAAPMRELYEEALRKAPSPFEAGQLYSLATGRRPYDFSGTPTAGMRRKLNGLLEQRLSGVPLQYIIGKWEFYSLPFIVGPGVLIPRQDTETLVDAALDALKTAGENPEVLDLCSGTGCVAVAVKANYPRARVFALEISSDAFSYMTKNIDLNHADVFPVLGDLREYTHPALLDVIVSNPPYIPRGELSSLQAEVRREPVSALDGGRDGLSYFRAIARRYKRQLKPGGTMLLEIGAGQQDAVRSILAGHGFSGIRAHADLNGIARVMEASRE